VCAQVDCFFQASTDGGLQRLIVAFVLLMPYSPAHNFWFSFAHDTIVQQLMADTAQFNCCYGFHFVLFQSGKFLPPTCVTAVCLAY